MKKKLLFYAFAFIFAISFSSCEKDPVTEDYQQEYNLPKDTSKDHNKSNCNSCDVLVDPGDGGGGATYDCDDYKGLTGDCDSGNYYYQIKKHCEYPIKMSGAYSRNSSGNLVGTITASSTSSSVTIMSQGINFDSQSDILRASVYYKIRRCQPWYEPNGTGQGVNCQDDYYSFSVVIDPCDGTITR